MLTWGADVESASTTTSVAAMRRTLTVVLLASLTLAACGSDSGSDGGADGASSSDSTPADSVTVESDPTATPEATGAPATNPDKPAVEIPAEIPTELTVTVLAEGEGPAAAPGDTVIVDYVGVRSSDGVEFDNSYDRFEPFPVVLGSGSVIPGWEDGLVGAQAGARIQLDIPSDQAYGAEARGDIIGENEALTFVIDVRSVIIAPDPADAPTEPGVPPSAGATEVTTEDLVEGDGAAVEVGQTAMIHYVLYRGDNLAVVESTWENSPQPIKLADGMLPGLLEGIPGMKVGGRRAIVIPPEAGFGPEGNPQAGLPANTDLIMVVDLLGAY